MEEIWKSIPGYEGYYEASNMGRIKSCYRMVILSTGRKITVKESILRPTIGPEGYASVGLTIKNFRKSFKVHRLIMLAFEGPSNLLVDHINGDKTDNRLENLEYVTVRENVSRAAKIKRDLPTGVIKIKNKYISKITVNGVYYHLGIYNTSEEAASIYQKALSDLDNIEKYARRFKDSIYGIGVRRIGNKFQVTIRSGKDKFFLGSFCTQKEANDIYNIASNDIANIEKYKKTQRKSKFGNGIRMRDNKFEVWVRKNKKQVYIGRYKTLDEAIFIKSTNENNHQD